MQTKLTCSEITGSNCVSLSIRNNKLVIREFIIGEIRAPFKRIVVNCNREINKHYRWLANLFKCQNCKRQVKTLQERVGENWNLSIAYPSIYGTVTVKTRRIMICFTYFTWTVFTRYIVASLSISKQYQ